MQTSRFKSVFSKPRRHTTVGKSGESAARPIQSASGLCLEHGDFVYPSDGLPSRPSTSLPRPETTSAFEPSQGSTSGKQTGGKLISLTGMNRRPHKSFSGLGDAIDEFRSNPTRILSKRKRSLFSLSRTNDGEDGGHTHKYSESCPANAVETEDARPSTPGWLRRGLTVTSRGPPPLYAAGADSLSFTKLPTYSYDDENLTALPLFPGCESETHKPPEHFASGAAARAAAAVQNEILDSLRKIRLQEPKVERDSESGVGIEVRYGGESSSDFNIPVVRQDPLAVLPLELVGHILSYLDACSLTKAEMVSHAWHNSATPKHVWRDVFRTEFQDAYPDAVPPNAGLGLRGQSHQNWKDMWRTRKALEHRWNDGHAAAIYLEGHTDSVYCVQFDKDKILTGSRDRTVRIWDARTFECIKVIGVPSRNPGSPMPPLQLDRLEEGQRPFTTVFSPRSNLEPVAPLSNLYHTGSILCLQYDDEIMVTGSSDYTLIIWDVKANYQPVRRLRHHTAGVLDVCFDVKIIVSCSKDATVCLWDRHTGEFLRKLSGHRGPVNAVQLRGELVVSASGDGIAKLWNLTSGLCIKEFPSKDRGMACVEFSPDARTILAGGNDQVIYQFDANTGELVREMKGHEGLVRSLHLDSASGRVVSGSYDTSVKAYNLRNGEVIVNFTKWTSSWILSAKADYRRIIATSQDSRAVVMDFGFQLPGIEVLEA